MSALTRKTKKNAIREDVTDNNYNTSTFARPNSTYFFILTYTCERNMDIRGISGKRSGLVFLNSRFHKKDSFLGCPGAGTISLL